MKRSQARAFHFPKCPASFFFSPLIFNEYLLGTWQVSQGKEKKRKTIQAPSLSSVEPFKFIGKQVSKIKNWVFCGVG
jgi:cytochrome oxidase assembly protein ShyY1